MGPHEATHELSQPEQRRIGRGPAGVYFRAKICLASLVLCEFKQRVLCGNVIAMDSDDEAEWRPTKQEKGRVYKRKKGSSQVPQTPLGGGIMRPAAVLVGMGSCRYSCPGLDHFGHGYGG